MPARKTIGRAKRKGRCWTCRRSGRRRLASEHWENPSGDDCPCRILMPKTTLFTPAKGVKRFIANWTNSTLTTFQPPGGRFALERSHPLAHRTIQGSRPGKAWHQFSIQSERGRRWWGGGGAFEVSARKLSAAGWWRAAVAAAALPALGGLRASDSEPPGFHLETAACRRRRAALEPVDPTTINVKLQLSDISFHDTLNAVVLVADHPIKYSVEDYAVVFRPNRFRGGTADCLKCGFSGWTRTHFMRGCKMCPR